MILVLAALACILVVGAAYFYSRRRDAEASGWTAGPTIGGKNYSPNVVVGNDGSFAFPTKDGVHYVTKAGSLRGKTSLRMRYRIDADPGVSFVASEGGGMAIGPTLYFQRRGDDWRSDGQRWFATFATPAPMKAGESEIIASFDQNWTSTETMSRAKNPQAFADALADTVRLGFVFGGGNGYGHGAYATGKARFTLLEFTAA